MAKKTVTPEEIIRFWDSGGLIEPLDENETVRAIAKQLKVRAALVQQVLRDADRLETEQA